MAETTDKRLFVSYSRTDTDFVRRLSDDLRHVGYTVWIDITGVRGGEQWVREIDGGVRGCDAFIVVVSPESMASQWVMREVILALNQRKQAIPVLWRKADLPVNLVDRQYIDFRNDYEQAFASLRSVLPEPPRLGPRLSEDVEVALSSEIGNVRWGAVAALIDIAHGDETGEAALARGHLEEMAQNDPDERVRKAAQSFFDEEEVLRLAEGEQIRQAEADARLEEAHRLQEEAARAQREAEEAHAELETAAEAREEALERARKAREITPARPKREQAPAPSPKVEAVTSPPGEKPSFFRRWWRVGAAILGLLPLLDTLFGIVLAVYYIFWQRKIWSAAVFLGALVAQLIGIILVIGPALADPSGDALTGAVLSIGIVGIVGYVLRSVGILLTIYEAMSQKAA